MPKLDIDEVRRLIRTEEEPAALREKLRSMIEEAHPAPPVFWLNETMPMHEFERRFKKRFCSDTEPAYAQWPVSVTVDEVRGGELILCLGITADGKPINGDRTNDEFAR